MFFYRFGYLVAVSLFLSLSLCATFSGASIKECCENSEKNLANEIEQTLTQAISSPNESDDINPSKLFNQEEQKALAKFAFIDLKKREQKEVFIISPHKNENNNIYPIQARKFLRLNSTESNFAVRFERIGLENLKESYSEFNESHKFLHTLLDLLQPNIHIDNLISHPYFYQYFDKEEFLMVPNIPYYNSLSALKYSKNTNR